MDFKLIFFIHFLYLIGVSFKHTLIGFRPDVYLATINGKNAFKTYKNIFIITKSSLDTPASIIFKCATASVVENPIYNIIKIIRHDILVLFRYGNLGD